MTEASTDMRSIVQKRANEIIANKLKADQGIIGENIESVAFESRQVAHLKMNSESIGKT
jgi:hypothetical protein